MVDEHALTDVIVDIYEDLKIHHQQIVLLNHRLDMLCETLSHLFPDFHRTQQKVARTVSQDFAATIFQEDLVYTEAIQKVKAGRLFRS